MTDFAAAANSRLLGSDSGQITEPTYDWSRDWRIIASRAQTLVCNDPFATAMVAAKLMAEHGATGLVPRSLAYLSADDATTGDERALRRQIEQACQVMAGRASDAAGLLSRKEQDIALSWMATVLGEGFAVRCWKPGRIHARYGTCWRLVRPERVCNPSNVPNSPTLYEGLVLDADGQIQGIWIKDGVLGPYGQIGKPTWTYVPWYSPDGTANVLHRIGWRLPGMLRGISMFTPQLLLLRQLGGVIESHVIGKRAQACTPVIYYVEDPEEAAKAAGADSSSVVGPHTKFNPLQVYFAKIGQMVEFKNVAFQGDDLQKFHAICGRVLTATWQMPVEVVLAAMGEAALASARAGLDQFDRTALGWHDDHTQQVSLPREAALVAEMVLLDEIQPGDAGLAGLTAFRYSRPPKYSTDRKKDAETVDIYINKLHRSKTAAFAEFGWNYEDEVEERIRDEEFERDARAAAGLPDRAAPTEAPAAPAVPPAAAPDQTAATGGV